MTAGRWFFLCLQQRRRRKDFPAEPPRSFLRTRSRLLVRIMENEPGLRVFT